MPKYDDLPAQYRLHADHISNAELPRPNKAVLIEFGSDGIPMIWTFGLKASPRETINALSDALKAVNTTASH